MIPQVFTFLRLKARFLKLDHKEGVSVSDNDVTYYIFSAESHLCYVGCSLATVIQVVEVLKKDAVPPFFLQGVFFNWASPEMRITKHSIHLWLFLPHEDIVNQLCTRSTK